jgi:hypothetical protein
MGDDKPFGCKLYPLSYNPKNKSFYFDADCPLMDPYIDSLQDAGLRCDACNEKKEAKDLLACSACKVARYCSKNCQSVDWGSRHKAVCAALRRGRGS